MPTRLSFTRRALIALAAFGFAASAGPGRAADGPLVLAAASLQESLGEAADAWAKSGRPRPRLSFAASSALARQIIAGAPADMFISADEAWMDAVEKKGLLRSGTRADMASNRLVLIAPAASAKPLPVRRGMPLAAALGNGRLAIAEPDSVPAGRYARAALDNLGLWASVSGKLAYGDSVRSVLALVERGEVPLGIVYATDAMASARVREVGSFPPQSHPPIRYPLGLLKSASPDAAGFRAFLLSSAGRAILARHGFGAP